MFYPILFYFAELEASGAPVLTPTGSISAEWVLAGMAIIIGFFMVRFMKSMDELTQQVISLRTGQEVLSNELKNTTRKMEKVEKGHEAFTDAITKLYAMQGGTGGRHWPYTQDE